MTELSAGASYLTNQHPGLHCAIMFTRGFPASAPSSKSIDLWVARIRGKEVIARPGGSALWLLVAEDEWSAWGC